MVSNLLFETLSIIVCLYWLDGRNFRVTCKMICMVIMNIGILYLCDRVGYNDVFTYLIYLMIAGYARLEFSISFFQVLFRMVAMLVFCAGIQILSALPMLLLNSLTTPEWMNLAVNLLTFLVIAYIYKKVDIQPFVVYVNKDNKKAIILLITISGLIFAAIVLLAETGIWGFYCYSRTLPGDTNVQASTFMYCLAVFAGSFWAAAVVKRRSLKPSLFICGVFLGLSLLISLHLFSWQEIKLKMLLLKILLTFAAAAGGFVLSLVPYLINKSIKKKRQAQEQRRQRQLEHRQMMQQQRELEQELARRARNNFRP